MRRVGAIGLGLTFLLGWAAEEQGYFRQTEKAYYADKEAISFVRPGLVVKIVAAAIAANGTITADVRVTDPRGLPLDREGNESPGVVSLSFIAAVLPQNETRYTSYTTRVRVAAGTGRQATQAAADANGTFTKLEDGLYRYTFRTPAPSSIDRSATHTIGVYASRNLTEFELGTNFASNVFHFVPAGGAVTRTHDIIRTETCNGCHGDLNFHGGSRRGVEMCVLCHTPQSSDPVTGNTIDMAVMTHKIHTGADLPSVAGGGKYQLNGFAGLVDYSKIRFSGNGGTRNCGVCHKVDADPAKRAAQSQAHLTNPTRANCGSCHDDINFATGAGHRGLAQTTDANCGRCHVPQGDSEFDASIGGAHVRANFSETLEGVVLQITRIDDGAAGKRPVVTFTVKTRAGAPIPLPQLDRLVMYLSGPAADYATQTSTDARTATAVGDGSYRITFPNAIPAEAKGTYRISMVSRKRLQLMAGTEKQRQADDIATNAQMSFSVDGSPVAARRQVVDTAKCNACHVRLTFHGTQNTVDQCVMCHTADLVDGATRQSAQFTTMIHRIHSGKELGVPYKLGSDTWDHVGYPGVRSNCNGCHINNSQQLPLRDELRAVKEPAGPITDRKPETNACTSCHASATAVAHAQANTGALGESCSVCHGSTSEFSADRVHAQ
ncbi:MAG: OmcA/MtrC family decaheme c-type cytochrome [Bryobacterales bacterium]|nr:OmcA/MtrC family decaheme c-type cytochrome [Bryobacterales bacterium]